MLDLEFALEFFSLALNGLLNFLIVLLGLLLDGIELLDVALLCDLVPLCCLSQEFFLLSPLVGGLAFSDKLDLVVVGLGLLLNVGDRSFPVHFSGLELFTEFSNGLLTLSTFIRGPALAVELNFGSGLLDLRDCCGYHIGLSLIGFLEFLLNLFECWLRSLLSCLKALLHRWIGIELLWDVNLEADWLRCCVLVLVHVL